MRTHTPYRLSASGKILRWVYILTMLMMGFTGFGQMPIFKRYYISDIPGMSWSADFFMTHYLHYLGAILLIGLIAYFLMDYLLSGRREFRLTYSAWIRMAFLAGLVITGIFRVLKNLPDVAFSPGFTQFIDISHLGFMMLYLFSAILFLGIRSGWVSVPTHGK